MYLLSDKSLCTTEQQLKNNNTTVALTQRKGAAGVHTRTAYWMIC